MAELERFVFPLVCGHLGHAESAYLSEVFERFDGYPSLQQLGS